MLDRKERWCPVCRELLARRTREVRMVRGGEMVRFQQRFLYCGRCDQGWRLQTMKLKV